MLNRDSQTRITIEEIKVDPFFQPTNWEKVLMREYTPPLVEFIDEQGDDNVNLMPSFSL